MKVATTLIIASLFVIALVTPVSASEHGIEEEGSILFGVPVAVQNAADPCNPDSELNGLFSAWYDVSELQGESFEILVSENLDIDPLLWDADCEFIDYGGAPLGFLGADESGTISEGSHFLLVQGYVGSGDYTLTVG